MTYLDWDGLQKIEAATFQQQHPYPWVNIQNSLTTEGFERLRATLPDVSCFSRNVGGTRYHGQGYHSRCVLHHYPGLEVAQPWREFIAELHAPKYQDFIHWLCKVPRRKQLILTLEWYYGFTGCSVSPHCDARRKLATHLFYFNTEADWERTWGGDVLILDDGARLRPHSSPSFDELQTAAALDARGNSSLLFQRTNHSWHGVRPLQSPPDAYRKLFNVTINVPCFQVWWRRVRGKDADGYRVRTAG
jgi:hypothetical protein